jgi:tRNA G46 methylase TrmB
LAGNSRPVTSNQRHLHPRLAVVVQRHLHSVHQGVVAAHSRSAYQALTTALLAQPRPLVLDSFCGTGHSTAALAQRHPDHLVVGIDKSAQRLHRHPHPGAPDYLLLQGNCEDLWQLLADDNLCVDYHYMLYPNPWPKSGHLQRRVHGHASFPLLLRLGGRLELRSNWQLYVEEFGTAMHLAGQRGIVRKLPPQVPTLSLFEQKYQNSGHELWSYSADIMPVTSQT